MLYGYIFIELRKKIQNLLEFFDIAKMLIENSSKSYPKIHSPDNRPCQSIQVQICNEYTSLSSKNFFELTQIINLSTLPEIKNSSLNYIVYNERNLLMFHIFLYYCIKVQMKIQIQGLEGFYLKELGNLYVEGGFNIQIGKFAKMCEICLGIDARKCAHIIYYLVYGRLATNSYINNLINQILPKSVKKQKFKTVLSAKTLNKKQNTGKRPKDSKMGSEKSDNSLCQELADDLKKIFNGDSTEKQGKLKPLDRLNKQNSLDNSTREGQKQSVAEHPQKKYYMNFFPNRVFNEEKSAIFQSIYPSHKSHYKLMRKKKFNDEKIEKMFCQTFTLSNQTPNKDQDIDQKPSINKERNKIFTHSAIRTNQKFKNTGSQLDKIRTTITKPKRKTTALFYPNLTIISEQQRKYTELLQKSKTNRDDYAQKQQHTEIIKGQYQNQNTIISLIRKQTKNLNKRKKNHDQMYNEVNQDQKSILKNLENISQNTKINRMFHSQCQNRLYKYKNEYRKFMKVHLFKNDDQS